MLRRGGSSPDENKYRASRQPLVVSDAHAGYASLDGATPVAFQMRTGYGASRSYILEAGAGSWRPSPLANCEGPKERQNAASPKLIAQVRTHCLILRLPSAEGAPSELCRRTVSF